MINEFPLAIVFNSPFAAMEKVHMRGQKGGFQETEDGIVQSVIEIPAGNDSVNADSG